MLLKVELYADGAGLEEIAALARDSRISGFTTNPTLMRKAGVADYQQFALEALRLVAPRPLSLEVLSASLEGMEREARHLAALGYNAVVKVPCTTTQGVSTAGLVRRLAAGGIPVNVTAVMTLEQVITASDALGDYCHGWVSVFAGRIADTGRDPVPMMTAALAVLARHPLQRLIWASPRELLNVVQADDIGCHVITATPDILKKLPLLGKPLRDYSLETVKMFYEDGLAAGYRL